MKYGKDRSAFHSLSATRKKLQKSVGNNGLPLTTLGIVTSILEITHRRFFWSTFQSTISINKINSTPPLPNYMYCTPNHAWNRGGRINLVWILEWHVYPKQSHLETTKISSSVQLHFIPPTIAQHGIDLCNAGYLDINLTGLEIININSYGFQNSKYKSYGLENSLKTLLFVANGIKNGNIQPRWKSAVIIFLRINFQMFSHSKTTENF